MTDEPPRIYKRMTEEEAQLMIEAYLAGKPTREAAALCGYTKRALTELLRRRSIEVRQSSAARKLYYHRNPDLTFVRKYALDETFFDRIDNEHKAYWLGFLTADGNINPENSSVRLTLQKDDANHILKFKEAVCSEQPLYYTERTNAVGIEIGSRRLMRSLQRLGLEANKTYSAQPCPAVPQELQRHYWRGLVDGDGSIHYTGPLKGTLVVNLCGTKAIVEGFRAFVVQFVNTKAQINHGHGKSYQISFAHRLARQICKQLYSEATIYLDRKYELAHPFFAEQMTLGFE